MKQVLYIVDVQTTFSPPAALVRAINSVAAGMPSVATVELHDESKVPFRGQLGWSPKGRDESLIDADQVFIKYGYNPPAALLESLSTMNLDRVLVCGMQTDTCVLAAGFALFDAGLRPTLIESLTVGSSLDRSGALGISLWKHHFGSTIEDHHVLLGQLDGSPG